MTNGAIKLRGAVRAAGLTPSSGHRAGACSPFSEEKPSTSLTCPQSDPHCSIILNERQPFVSGSHLSGLRWLLPLRCAENPPSLPPPRSERAASAARCSPRPCPASPGPSAAHRGRLPRSLPGRRERLPGPGSPAPGAREPPPRPSRRPSRRPVPPSRAVPGDPLWPPLLLPFPSPRTGCERKLSSGKGS